MSEEQHARKKRKTGGLSRKSAEEETGWEELQLVDESVQAPGAAAAAAGDYSKQSRHARKHAKDQKEQEIRQAELKRLQGNAAPTSATEFEALVLSSPNSSLAWVQYMAFAISLGEVDRARALAERALAAIHYREEGEKFNIWVAWLNLEVAYGSEEGALGLLGRALCHADARRMYLAAVDVFERAGKGGPVEDCLKAMCRKFADSPEVWLRAIKYRLGQGEAEAAQRVLDRSLKSLPRFEHVRMVSQAALLEFRSGDAERGRSLFEGVLRNFPKRLDLWSVYLDQEIGTGDAGRARALFERATSLSLPPKKMKFLFKRYLDYEKERGTAAGVAHVKKRALEFVEAHAR